VTWTITWDAVDNADYYTVNLSGGPDQRTETNTITLNLTGSNIVAGNTYNIWVTAHSNSESYTDSETAKVQLTYDLVTYNVIFKFVYTDESGNTKEVSRTQSLPLGSGENDVSQYLPTNYMLAAGQSSTINISTSGTFEIKVKPASESD